MHSEGTNTSERRIRWEREARKRPEAARHDLLPVHVQKRKASRRTKGPFWSRHRETIHATRDGEKEKDKLTLR